MNSEKIMFEKILNLNLEQLENRFDYRENDVCYTFVEKANNSNYVTVSKNVLADGIASVNADFRFSRPAGSNNYKELLSVAKKLLDAFDLNVNWIS